MTALMLGPVALATAGPGASSSAASDQNLPIPLPGDAGESALWEEEMTVDWGVGLAVPSADPGLAISYKPDMIQPVPASGGGATLAAACTQLRVQVWYYYYNERGEKKPLSDITVRIWDEEYGSDYLLRTGVSNANGYYISDWISNDDGWGQGLLDIYADAYAWTSAIAVKDRFSDDAYSFYTTTVNEADPSSTSCILNLNAWQPKPEHNVKFRHYSEGISSWKFASSLGDGAMPLVKVYYPSDTFDSHYEPAWCCRVIALNSADDSRYHVLYHEHGHAVMDWAYGWENFPIEPGQTHSTCGDSQPLDLAWGEGWANFWTVYVRSKVFGDYQYSGRSIESYRCSGVLGQDAEWNVATTLWDLYDSSPDGSDLSGYGANALNPSTNSIWKVMRSGADPQTLGDFRAKWRSMTYSAAMFDGAASQNSITSW